MNFEDLNLHSNILKALSDSGYKEATKIQEAAIPKVIEGIDIRASAQTGTGKTAAFLLPALNKLTVPSTAQGKGPRILILVPTRELAMQITEQSEKYSKYMQAVKTVCVVGGVPYHVQMKKMMRPYDILIATPGRLIDFIQQGKINFSRVEMLILDEADRMLDMGFTKPVEDIVSALPPGRQTLLFSATLRGSVIKLSDRLMDNPMEIVIHGESSKHDNITQTFHYVDNMGHKNRILDHILNTEGVDYTIIFTATKRHADQLVRELKEKGYMAGALHGDMNQRQRTRTLAQLKSGKLNVLVATDVAARGIDIQSITHVINFDLPNCAEDYVHRIGRTGRAGAKGTAISFASNRDSHLLREIEKFTGQRAEIKEIEGLEPTKQSRSPGSYPSKGRRRSNGGGGGFKGNSRYSNSRSSGSRYSDDSRSSGSRYSDSRSSDSRSSGSRYSDSRSSDSRSSGSRYSDSRSSDSRSSGSRYSDSRSSDSRSSDSRSSGSRYSDSRSSGPKFSGRSSGSRFSTPKGRSR